MKRQSNLPPAGGKLHRLFHPSMPEISVTPIHRKTREVQIAAGGRQIAPTSPFIDARIFGNAQSIVKRGRCNLPPEGGKLHRLFHSSMPDFSVFSFGKGSPLHKRFGSGSGSANSSVRYDQAAAASFVMATGCVQSYHIRTKHRRWY